MKTIILLHKIDFRWKDGIERDLDDCNIEYIKKCIGDGFGEGELNQMIDRDNGIGVYGWWKIAK